MAAVNLCVHGVQCMKIPFNKPFIIGNELRYMAEAVSSGHIAGDGLFTKKCHSFMERRFRQARYC